MAEIAEASDAQWENNQVLEFNESDIRDCHQRRGYLQIVLQDADKNMVKLADWSEAAESPDCGRCLIRAIKT